MSSITASEAKAALLAIEADVGVDHTAKGGVYDLSGVDAVRIGRFLAPVAGAPFVWIAPPGVATVNQDGPPLGHYAYDITFDLGGFVSAADSTVRSRALAALDLMNDVTAAIQCSGRDAGTLATVPGFRDVTVEGFAMDGDEHNLAPGYGFFFAIARVRVHRRRGI